MRRTALLGLAVLTVAGCGPPHPAGLPPFRDGPPNVVRIALADLRWPLDPALAESRDEVQLARTLYSTPLRVGPHNHLLPGLCSSWRGEGFRTWTLHCRHAKAIAAELRRVAAMPEAPSAWLFADAKRIDARGDQLRIGLARPWRHFPYALTAVAAAPRGVPGPFRVASASPGRLTAVRPGLRLEFRRMEPHAAAAAFRRAALDEAPVALGDIRAAKLDPALREMVRSWSLLGVDLVAFQLRNGPLADLPNTRRAYWQTADRQSYALLVPEGAAPAAYGLASPRPHGSGSAAQTARRNVGSLPPVAVPVAVENAPDLVYAARLAVAQWRDVGLGASLHPLPKAGFRAAVADATTGAWFGRVLAPYPQTEALLGQVLLPRGGRNPWPAADSTPAATLRTALGAPDENPRLDRIDEQMRAAAAVVPLADVADARLVSPRLQNWREDLLGSVDYTRVRARASSRRP